mmetsp:Transcript_7690/g.11753  ORF Transcript_7690/g.11753 Transcript_7690/m.11753 type:complete len:203 (-) Transcript_7690:182-790(-)
MSRYEMTIIGLNRHVAVERRSTQIAVGIGHQTGNRHGWSWRASFLDASFNQTIHDLIHHINSFFGMDHALLSLALRHLFETQTQSKGIERCAGTGNVQVSHVAEQDVVTDSTGISPVLEQHVQNGQGSLSLFGRHAVHAAIVVGVDNGNVHGCTIVGIQFPQNSFGFIDFARVTVLGGIIVQWQFGASVGILLFDSQPILDE